jgi:predicted alpha/beta superfamily hydrolase
MVMFLQPFQPDRALAGEQGKPIVLGQEITIHSKILGEDRPLRIALPVGYDKVETRYPVLYILDGEYQFNHTAAVARFLAMFGCAPKMIVVAVPNTDRARDLWPVIEEDETRSRYVPAENSKRFFRFLEEELIPHVDGTYRTQPYRILAGHCMAGLFTLHAFMAKPDLFQAHIAMTPYLLYGDKLCTPYLEAFLARNPDMKGFLYITQGKESDEWLANTDKFVELLMAHAPAGLECHFKRLENEAHGSEILESLHGALKVLYKDWRMPDDLMTRGRTAVEEHFAHLSKAFGYEIPIPENTCNLLGYTLLKQKKVDDAIEVFKRNAAAYPASWNVYDSLAEAYMTAGEKELAIRFYKKSLALNPDNQNGREMLKKLGCGEEKPRSL